MKTLSFILICLLIFSCKNTKQIVKSETEVKTVTEQQSTKTEDSKTDIKVDKTIAESITEKENTVIKETITKLSKPDSLGNQYPEEIINRETSSGKNSETKTDTKEELNKASENKIIETDNKIEDKIITNETDTKIVKKQQSWKTILLIVLALVLVGILLWKVKGGAIKSAINKLKK